MPSSDLTTTEADATVYSANTCRAVHLTFTSDNYLNVSFNSLKQYIYNKSLQAIDYFYADYLEPRNMQLK